MKNIIVPIDFSRDSYNGLSFAITIANQIEADITLVYVQKEDNDLYSNNRKTVIEKAETAMEEIVEKFRGRLKATRLDYKVREGRVHKEVVNQAKYNDSCLIICSTHGTSGFEEIFIGSNAFKIVSAANCPVITVRKGMVPEDIKKIVMPIDITRETRQKVPFTAELAKLFDAEIHVLMVRMSDAEWKTKTLNNYGEQVKEFLTRHEVRFIIEELKGSNISDMVLAYAQGVGADLLSIMTEQEQTLENILIGPYAQQMVNHSIVPVVSIHNKELYRWSILSPIAVANPFK
ncbi:MAG: universal stress protein [Bacteroidetes bacterium]|nr:universal stress protein [Bacteroidota bacterium]MBU1718666.1 universal stress protein [Bacteroidota bacterium]